MPVTIHPHNRSCVCVCMLVCVICVTVLFCFFFLCWHVVSLSSPSAPSLAPALIFLISLILINSILQNISALFICSFLLNHFLFCVFKPKQETFNLDSFVCTLCAVGVSYEVQSLGLESIFLTVF